ncbi:hypothetical protein CB1_000298003 [Camelus ferus]|nr:hypothetical protein CB1_000298003 [Camelus ferus]
MRVSTILCVRIYLVYFITLRHPDFSGRSPHSSATEMEQEKVNESKELSADAASYRCSACHGDEDWGLGHPIRGRAKSRSLSASPALASTREFRCRHLVHLVKGWHWAECGRLVLASLRLQKEQCSLTLWEPGARLWGIEHLNCRNRAASRVGPGVRL